MYLEIKKLWVDGLKSGDYPQAQATLKTETGFCCLGVLCDIYKKQTGKGKWVGFSFIVDEGPSEGLSYRYAEENDTALVDSVRAWAGLSSIDPMAPFRVKIFSDSSSVEEFDTSPAYYAAINDSGETFDHIADLINHFE